MATRFSIDHAFDLLALPPNASRVPCSEKGNKTDSFQSNKFGLLDHGPHCVPSLSSFSEGKGQVHTEGNITREEWKRVNAKIEMLTESIHVLECQFALCKHYLGSREEKEEKQEQCSVQVDETVAVKLGSVATPNRCPFVADVSPIAKNMDIEEKIHRNVFDLETQAPDHEMVESRAPCIVEKQDLDVTQDPEAIADKANGSGVVSEKNASIESQKSAIFDYRIGDIKEPEGVQENDSNVQPIVETVEESKSTGPLIEQDSESKGKKRKLTRNTELAKTKKTISTKDIAESKTARLIPSPKAFLEVAKISATTNLHKQKVVFCVTGKTGDARNMLISGLEKLGNCEKSENWSEECTHLIVTDGVKRTQKIISAILYQKYLVPEEWGNKSIEAGNFVDEVEFKGKKCGPCLLFGKSVACSYHFLNASEEDLPKSTKLLYNEMLSKMEELGGCKRLSLLKSNKTNKKKNADILASAQFLVCMEAEKELFEAEKKSGLLFFILFF